MRMAGLTYVAHVDTRQGDRLRERLESRGYEFRDVDHARFGARGEGVNVVLYRSGKLVVQGKGVEAFRNEHLLELLGPPPARLKARTVGADETGKGDYFGPLVVASCALSPEEEPFLDEVPLHDSKTLSDAQCRRAARQLTAVLPHEVIAIGPRKYNELHRSFGNLNALMAWAHARAILAVVDRSGCRKVVLDRFCDEVLVTRALKARAAELDLEIRPRAEDDPAVAAASIVARAAFLDGLEKLGRKVGMKLPKGAGPPVLQAGRKLVARHGEGVLPEVAKVHFKTTGQLTG